MNELHAILVYIYKELQLQNRESRSLNHACQSTGSLYPAIEWAYEEITHH